MAVLGIGHDVVDLAQFAEQLSVPGSRMKGLFSARELRQTKMRAQQKHDGEAVHLAAKWAGKESVIKAWCAAIEDDSQPYPYTLDTTPWAQIEILDNERGVPHVVLGAAVHKALVDSLTPSAAIPTATPTPIPTPTSDLHHLDRPMAPTTPITPTLQWHISLSHDGSVASAFVLLESVSQ